MASIIFLKEKYNRDIKGRALVDGRKHQEIINKEKDYSTTVATESVFLTAAVNSHEGPFVVAFDIPGVYGHT